MAKSSMLIRSQCAGLKKGVVGVWSRYSLLFVWLRQLWTGVPIVCLPIYSTTTKGHTNHMLEKEKKRMNYLTLVHVTRALVKIRQRNEGSQITKKTRFTQLLMGSDAFVVFLVRDANIQIDLLKCPHQLNGSSGKVVNGTHHASRSRKEENTRILAILCPRNKGNL